MLPKLNKKINVIHVHRPILTFIVCTIDFMGSFKKYSIVEKYSLYFQKKREKAYVAMGDTTNVSINA